MNIPAVGDSRHKAKGQAGESPANTPRRSAKDATTGDPGGSV